MVEGEIWAIGDGRLVDVWDNIWIGNGVRLASAGLNIAQQFLNTKVKDLVGEMGLGVQIYCNRCSLMKSLSLSNRSYPPQIR